MYKKYFTTFIAIVALQACAFADDAVFSNNEPEQFTLQPLNYSESAPAATSESSTDTVPVAKPVDSQVANSSYMQAIGNLDNAQIELREQAANYTALMAQAKTEYQSKKAEYNAYKKQCSNVKKKMRNIEASKKKIQQNVNIDNQ